MNENTKMNTENLNYEGLANFLCGDTSPEAKKAHEEYCEAYDKAHKDDNQMA